MKRVCRVSQGGGGVRWGCTMTCALLWWRDGETTTTVNNNNSIVGEGFILIFNSVDGHTEFMNIIM
jgi:hypothetical protein